MMVDSVACEARSVTFVEERMRRGKININKNKLKMQVLFREKWGDLGSLVNDALVVN